MVLLLLVSSAELQPRGLLTILCSKIRKVQEFGAAQPGSRSRNKRELCRAQPELGAARLALKPFHCQNVSLQGWEICVVCSSGIWEISLFEASVPQALGKDLGSPTEPLRSLQWEDAQHFHGQRGLGSISVQTEPNLTTFVISRNIPEQEGDPDESLEPSSHAEDEVQP